MSETAFVTARTQDLGEVDPLAVGSTACRHLDEATGLEYAHAERACLAPYERPRGVGAGLAPERLDALRALHAVRADEAEADAAQAEAAATAALAADDLDEVIRQRKHARAALRLAMEYRTYAHGYRDLAAARGGRR